MPKHTINSEQSLQSFIGDMREEIWKDVPNYEGIYQASNYGRVRSVDRVVNSSFGAKRKIKGRIVALNGGKRIYLRVSAKKYGVLFSHRLVAMTFIDNPHNLPVINHIDGNKQNNHISNLEWCTQNENMKHAYRTGLVKIRILGRGDDSIASKLTGKQVSLIKRRLINGERAIDLAREYKVNKNTIGELKAGRSWSHVDAADN